MSTQDPKRRVIPLRRAPRRGSGTGAPLPPFAELLWENLDALYRTARHVVGSTDAADVVQEAALRAFRGYAGLRDGARARVWLLQVLRRTALDHLRGRARVNEIRDAAVETVLDAARTSGERFERRIHARQAVEQAFAGLAAEFREVVWLVDGEGLSVDETAQVLELPAGTVASRLFRGRRKLRRALGEGGSS